MRMEQNNQADVETRTDYEVSNADDFPDSQNDFQKKKETDEGDDENKVFKDEIEAILSRIRNLPSEAAEFKVSIAKRDSKEVYRKLCRVLKVPENSSFFDQLDGEKMDFSYQCLGPVGVIPVTKALATCKTVKILDLKYNKLGKGTIPAVMSLIEQNENITHLNLAANEIGKGNAKILGELVSRCFSVEFLDLSKNNLGDEELLEIGMALVKVDSVKELALNTNDFSSAKAPQFGPCVGKCSALSKLDLSCCHFEEGAANIFGGLKMSNLTALNLASNGIPDSAMQALASGLRANKSLQELDISYNNISGKGAVTLAPGVKGSSTLEILRLAHNPIMGSAATKILTSVGGSLKLLDLSGIRVDLAFYKSLRNHAKAGRDIKVMFGSEIRYDIFPRDLTAADETSLSKDNVLSYLEKLADEKGVSLRNTLKDIHATFIKEQHEKLAEEQQQTNTKEEKARPEMKTTELAKALVSSALAVPKTVVTEVSELLREDRSPSEEGVVDMWKLIKGIRWKPDDLNVKIKGPKKSPADKKKKDKGKKKK